MIRERAWTILDLIRRATSDFTEQGIESARLDAELLLSHVLDCTRVDLYLRFDELPGEEKLAGFREVVRRRRSREPVAYILEKKAFRDIELKVSRAVMVPRPETELLVDGVISCISKSKGQSRRVLDLGTGSGAIALSLARELSGIEVWASDISEPALEIAKENAGLLGVADRVNFVQGDLFQPFSGHARFDLIVSNPPYIPSHVLPGLMPEIRDFEPRVSLDGGPEGLDFISAIIEGSREHLASAGWLWLEVGDGQAERVIGLGKRVFSQYKAVKDYSGIERALGFHLESE